MFLVPNPARIPRKYLPASRVFLFHNTRLLSPDRVRCTIIKIFNSPAFHSRVVKFSVPASFPQTPRPPPHTPKNLRSHRHTQPSKPLVGHRHRRCLHPQPLPVCRGARGANGQKEVYRGLFARRWRGGCRGVPVVLRRPDPPSPVPRSARRPTPMPVRGLPHPPPDPAADEVLPRGPAAAVGDVGCRDYRSGDPHPPVAR